MARKLPDPAERSKKDPAVLCSRERVLGLYKTHKKEEAKRLTKKVKEWFLETAREEGWDAAIFIKEVESAHGAGCILYKNFDTPELHVFVEGPAER